MLKTDISGIHIDCYNKEEILNRVEIFIKEKKPHQIVTLNSLMLNLAFKDSEMKKVLMKSSLNIPESTGIVWAIKYLKGIDIERLPGIDLMCEILTIAERNGYKVYLIGSKKEVIEKAVENIRNKHPEIKISGYNHGYWKDEKEEKEIIENIRNSSSDILFIGLSLGKQEKWISKNLENLGVPVVMGVGGSFDVLSGRLKRAPVFFRKTGFEWLFRFIQEPVRMKNIITLLLFIINILLLKEEKN